MNTEISAIIQSRVSKFGSRISMYMLLTVFLLICPSSCPILWHMSLFCLPHAPHKPRKWYNKICIFEQGAKSQYPLHYHTPGECQASRMSWTSEDREQRIHILHSTYQTTLAAHTRLPSPPARSRTITHINYSEMKWIWLRLINKNCALINVIGIDIGDLNYFLHNWVNSSDARGDAAWQLRGSPNHLSSL